MLPEFPNFKPIELADKEDVEKITGQHPPYSDFNFVSMWSWDVQGQMRICTLNGNLVVRFTDYLNGEPFYSFLGSNNVTQTTETLIAFSRQEGVRPVLALVPENSLAGLGEELYLVEEDPDNFDYIYESEQLAHFSGKKYQNKRCLYNKFSNTYQNAKVVASQTLTPKIIQDILALDEQWIANKAAKAVDFDVKNEAEAVKRFFASVDGFTSSRFLFLCLYVDNRLVGFCISSIINKEYALCHFMKGDIQYAGVYEYLFRHYGQNLAGIARQVNYEQDLGLPLLRFSKNSFRPAGFLKKYVIIKL